MIIILIIIRARTIKTITMAITTMMTKKTITIETKHQQQQK